VGKDKQWGFWVLPSKGRRGGGEVMRISLSRV
jgi:hypothetical protein